MEGVPARPKVRHTLGDKSQGLVAGTCFGDQSPSMAHLWSLQLVPRIKLVRLMRLVAGANRSHKSVNFLVCTH